MALAEREVAAGRHAEWPMVLAALPHLADPAPHRLGRPAAVVDVCTRARRARPSTMTETVTAVFEQFAPGFRDIVVAARGRARRAAGRPQRQPRRRRHRASAATTLFSALAGPTLRLNPWTTPIPGVYLCSSATPPGAGVHGMAGYYAARTVLRREFGIDRRPPSRLATMTKLAIIYYSATGTRHRDGAVASPTAARERPAPRCGSRHIAETRDPASFASNPAWSANYEATKDLPAATGDDIVWADAVIFGSPTAIRLGVSSQFRTFIDSLGGLWAQGKLADKVYAGFTSSQTGARRPGDHAASRCTSRSCTSAASSCRPATPIR